MIAQFVTVEADAPFPYTLWDEDETGVRVVSRHADRSEIEVNVPEYVFEAPSSSLPGSDANETRFPVVDRNGASLWPGSRVRYQIERKSRRGEVHLVQGDATFEKVTIFGLLLHCDEEHDLLAAHPSIPDGRTNRMDFTCSYRPDGALPGHLVADQSRVKPFRPSEPAATRVEVYVELIEDPRLVCQPRPTPSLPQP